MVQVIHIISICAGATAFVVLSLCVNQWRRGDPQFEEIRNRPSAVEGFKESDSHARDLPSAGTAPLIAQAEALALYLNPPKGPESLPTSGTAASSASFVPPIRSAASSVKFKLHGTSYYPNQPGRSMALIAELGSVEGNERWVKEGSQLGHFVIHEIRHGVIVYRDGDNLREMAVEPGMSMPSIVRDLRPGARQVSAAVEGVAAISLAGPNSIEITGGN